MQLVDQKYQLTNGVDPLKLVEKYGQPIFVYDTAIFEQQYSKMKDAFSVKDFAIYYAAKASSNINILHFFKNLGSGLDTVSIQEVELGLIAGFDPQRIMFTPSSVSMDEMTQAYHKGVRINIDNIPMLEQFGASYPDKPISIRLNPHIIAGGHHKISVGHINSKFGISIHQLPHVLKIVERLNLTIEGLHIHTGSDILDTDVFLSATEVLFDAAMSFKDLKFIDFGSGFKVAYKDHDIETDIEALGQKMSTRFNQFCEAYGRDLTLMFEPGKYLVSQGGYFLVQTNVIKQTTSAVFAAVDSGLNHFLRPMMYEAYHKIMNISRPIGKKRIYTIVGYICETDTLGIDRMVTEISEGDILAICNAGAYGMVMASNYNSRYRPAEVMIQDGQDYLIRREETLDDLLSCQIKTF